MKLSLFIYYKLILSLVDIRFIYIINIRVNVIANIVLEKKIITTQTNNYLEFYKKNIFYIA